MVNCRCAICVFPQFHSINVSTHVLFLLFSFAVCKHTRALAHWLMLSALNANAMCMSTAAEYSIVHFAHRFYARTINSNIKRNVKFSNRKVISVNRVIEWANIRAYVAKHAIVTIMCAAKDSSMRKMHRFHVQNAIMKRRKRKTSACRHARISSVVKVPMITMIMMMIIKHR